MSYPDVKVTQQPIILKEDEKIPLFLIKLWNIVEDPSYFEIIRWDDSGYTFHILDPYSFCHNVLPQYFKHNNLNSLIRQLNMYGFRKMTPIERTSLARAESDQDHLEFSHPFFVRDHPELLVNIKRKAPQARQTNAEGTVSVPTKDLSAVFEELRSLRERQKEMEEKMGSLSKENEMIWQEMGRMRGAHVKQQQIVSKLVQFMMELMQSQSKRIGGKRSLLAIDEMQPKRSRRSDEPDFHSLLAQQPAILATPSQPTSSNYPLEVTDNTYPVVTSPTVSGSIEPNNMCLSPNEFNEYLNGVDQSIDHCRDLIGGHWDDLDLDGWLTNYDEGQPNVAAQPSDPQPQNSSKTNPDSSTPHN